MKKIIAVATALTFLAGSGAAFAQTHHDDSHHDDHHPGPAMMMQGPAHGPAHGPAMHGPAMHGPAMAPRHNWRKGGHIAQADWGRGRHVDYHAHHLRRPPRGYEWREVDGNYVLAAVATGLIASIILANQ